MPPGAIRRPKAAVHGREGECAKPEFHMGGPRHELRLYAGVQALSYRHELDASAGYRLARADESIRLAQSAGDTELLSGQGTNDTMNVSANNPGTPHDRNQCVGYHDRSADSNNTLIHAA
jgi:hypothetical protein